MIRRLLSHLHSQSSTLVAMLLLFHSPLFIIRILLEFVCSIILPLHIMYRIIILNIVLIREAR